MLRGVLAGAVTLLLFIPAFAGEGGTSHPEQTGTPDAADTTLANMQEPAPGDRWTYEVRDEISGEVKRTQTEMITDVSKGEITVRVEVPSVDRPANIIGNPIYDHSWNIIRTGPFKYTPNDGTGIRLPLTLNAQWKFAIDVANSKNGMTFKRTGTSKVVGHESITTKGGTFDTFVIEINFTGKNIQDPTLINETIARIWFAPAIDHWVKRNVVLRQRGHVVSNNTIELTQYSRGKQQ